MREGRARSGAGNAKYSLRRVSSVVSVGGAREVRGPPCGDVGRFMKLRLFSAAENRVPLRERFDNQNEDHSGKHAGHRSIEALVENEALRFGNLFGGNFSACDLCGQAIGSSVTQIQRRRPIFIRMVVATTSATAASN